MSIVFNGDCAAGNISQYGNYQTQYLNSGAISNAPSLAANFVYPPRAVAGPSFRVDLPYQGEREELIPGIHAVEGDDWWIGWWCYLPASLNLAAGRGWNTIGQFHQTIPDGNPSCVHVQIPATPTPAIWILGNGGNSLPEDTQQGPAVNGETWTHMLLHIVFSVNPDLALVNWWVDGTQYVTNWHPTNGTIYVGDTRTLPKIGLHRNATSAPVTDVQFTNYTIATTRTEADRPLWPATGVVMRTNIANNLLALTTS